MLLALLAGATGAVSGLISWLRCRSARAWTGRPSVGVAASLVGGIVGVGLGFLVPGPHLLMPMHLLAVGLPLAVTDGLTGRLPRRAVLATYPTTIAALALTATWTGPDTLVGASIGAMALWILFLGMAQLGLMGNGDVRLAPVIGAHLGQAGLIAFIDGVALSFVLGGCATLALAALHRLGPDRRVPFGPALIGGGILVLAI